MKQFTFIILTGVLLFSSNLRAQNRTDSIHVSHYNINLEIRDLAQKEIKGYTDITIQAKKAPLTTIRLDLKKLDVDSVKKGNSIINYSHIGERLMIDLPFSTVNQTETIRVYYHGKPFYETFGGFYFKDDFAYNMGVGMSSVPHAFGRVWFPCMDEFTDKSTYTFNITTDADQKAVCGGMLVDSTNYGDTAKLWKWELTDIIPTYLASVAVGKYKVYRDTVHSISGNVLPIEIYADSTTLKKVPGSFVNLKTFIHTYEKRWGACRWQRVGYVAVPFNGGAMEHATSIAYPKSSITGNTNNQDLIAHELAHSWFGNLITCSSSHHMWINEGFATYGAHLCNEILDPTLNKFQSGMQDLHFTVLKSSETKLYALDNVPTTATYGTTSYSKGALVAHTLRNYMGDDKFFSSITKFLDENQYKNVNSEEFLQKLSVISGIDLTDFFYGWVHQKGFLNFNIDSIKPVAGTANKYHIALKQKLYYADYLANNNKIEVAFVSNTGEIYVVENIKFSGESAIVEVEIPFNPVFWLMDPNHKMGSACFGATRKITKTGNFNWIDQCFKIQVNEFSDTSIIRVEHNPVPPTSPKSTQSNIYRISEKHFWRIGFLAYHNMNADYHFSYNKSTYEKELLKDYTNKDMVVLYRKDAAHDWQVIIPDITIGDTIGTVAIKNIIPGEYTLGIGKAADIKDFENNMDIKVYPNPTTGELKIENGELKIENVEIFDVYGRRILNFQLSTFNSIDVSHLKTGTYILELHSKENKIHKKIIKL